jgi:hypothetical protein
MATPSAMALSSSTCHSVFPSGPNVGRLGATRATDCTCEVWFSVIIPLGATRANIRAAGCADNGALAAGGSSEWAPNARPSPLEGFASPARVRPISADEANNRRKTPATTVSRLIEARKFRNPPSPIRLRVDRPGRGRGAGSKHMVVACAPSRFISW